MGGRVAFVTGGAGGIGSAICRRLAASGCHVVVADLASAAAAVVADEVGGTGVQVDVSDPASCRAAILDVAEGPGPVEILVNCAGWDELKPFLETDDAFQSKVLDVNLGGPIRLTRLVLPSMVEARWGRIINIGSDAGRVGSSFEAIYSGAKGGLIAFTKTVAREMARHAITANVVCPGPTDTPLIASMMAASAAGDRALSSMTKAVPMRRMGQPDDIAPAVAYFASEEAAFVTGQTLSVSGGLTMA